MLLEKIKLYLENNNINYNNIKSYIKIDNYSDNKGDIISCWDKEKIGVKMPSKSELEKIKNIELLLIKKLKIIEAKAKREEKLSNFVVDEGIIEAKNKAETLLILKEYKEMLDQNITLAEFGLKDDKLIKLTKPIIEKWLLAISTQYNQAWIDYRAVKKKINNTKTITTLNKIIIK